MTNKLEIIGYFIESDANGKLETENIFVAINEAFTRDKSSLTCYSPTEGHGGMSKEYLQECMEITREQYIEHANGFYTPEEYL